MSLYELMPKIAINQDNQIVFMPKTYMWYKMVVDVTDRQLLLLLNLSSEELKTIIDQLLLSLEVNNGDNTWKS